jgi:hypothetical protein
MVTRLPAFLYIGRRRCPEVYLSEEEPLLLRPLSPLRPGLVSQADSAAAAGTGRNARLWLSVREPSPPEPPLPAGSRWWAPAMWTDYRRMSLSLLYQETAFR